MSTEYRLLTTDDLEAAAYLESMAFYNKPGPGRVELLRKFYPPEWTVGAFADGKLVADTRMVPMARRINGGAMAIGAVGPVACLAAYRRQGHVGKLLRLSLDLMRERGQSLSGLHTPHDALYRRFGWERAEGKKRYQFDPGDVQLRFPGARGRIEPATEDDWPRLDAIYRRYAERRNGPFHRIEVWWRNAVVTHRDGDDTIPNDAFVWVDEQGQDAGYVVYMNRNFGPPQGGWTPQEIWVRDFIALTADAHNGLWTQLFTHDLAESLAIEVPPDDHFRDLVEDPFKVKVTWAEGAMIRIVDIERAFAGRPHTGPPAAFTMAVSDATAPWNEGTWRVEASDGRLQAEKTAATPDVELTANTLAPLFTGFLSPETAALTGTLTVHRPEALAEMTAAFAVDYAPYCPDWY